ncbi:MAG TPA: insulinase family protein, partial [Polyangia bacterium]
MQSQPDIGTDTGPISYRLRNGLEVVLEESHLAPVVAIQAWVRVGAGDEPPTKAGIAHIVEHMLFKGTRRRAVGAVARTIEAAGGDINAWTSHDETAVHLILPSDRLALGIDVLADVLQRSVFDPKEFESERKVVLEEVSQGQDEPDRLAGVGLFASAFRRHPYGRPVIGHPKTVAGISRADAAGFFARHYGARNTTLVLTGDFRSPQARSLIEGAFGEMPPGRKARVRTPEPRVNRPRVTVIARDVKESQVLLAWACPPVSHPDLPALDLLAVALGQGESSRLHLELVRQRALVNATSTYLFTGRDPGLMIASASLVAGSDDAVTIAVEALVNQIETIKRADLTEAEIDRSRTLLESQRVFDRESAQGLARKLGFFASTIGDVAFEDRYLQRLAAVTAADVQRVASTYLRLDGLTLYAQVGRSADSKGAKASGREAIGKGRPDRPLTRRFEALIARLQRATPAPVAARKSAAAKRAAASNDVVSVRLSAGIRLLMMRDPQLPIVAMRGTWVGGLRHEDPKSNGASSLIASLLSRGTTVHDAEAIMRQVEGRAGTLSGHAGRNSLGLEAEFLTKHFEAGLDLFAECLTDSVFPDRELEHERRLSLEALRQQEDDVSHVAFRAF